MVGVPKRAQGCEACRKRRLTCGLERPTCLRCKKDGRECRFPTSVFTFVLNDAGSHRTVYRKPGPDLSTSTTTATTSTARNHGTSPDQELISAQDMINPTATATTTTTTIEPISPKEQPFHIPLPTPLITIPTIPLLQQQLFSYALTHFQPQPQTDTALMTVWIPTLRTSNSNNLKASPLACCAAWLARSDKNPTLIDFSRHLYAQGLREVRAALRVPGAILEDETLGACLALAVFEVFECPGRCREAYEWHRRASLELVRMRGTKRHREGVGHGLFLAVRLHGIFHAYEQKKPNFLCTREWSTVPWQSKPKDDFHALTDILARGPQLLAEAADLPNKPLEQGLPTLLTILSRLLDIDADLQAFYRKLEADNGPGPLYWAEVEEEEGEGEIATSSATNLSNLTFPSLTLASLLTLHWAIQVMVWSALEGIHAGLQQAHALPQVSHEAGTEPSSQTVRFLDLAPRRHWLTQVRKIVRSVDYSLSMTEGSATPPGIGVALEIVIDIMGQGKIGCGEEMRRAMEARGEMGRRWAKIFLR